MARLSGTVARSLADTRAAVIAAAGEQGWQVAKNSEEDSVWLFVETTGFTYASRMAVVLRPTTPTETRIEIETHRTALSFGNMSRGRLAARRMLRAAEAA